MWGLSRVGTLDAWVLSSSGKGVGPGVGSGARSLDAWVSHPVLPLALRSHSLVYGLVSPCTACHHHPSVC